ncbi:MAG: hypothetical protein K6G05_03455 [Lachnospiraceae bacterium]|nr:hypothetical protein [Lachnospiraceae bacterium]
MMKHRVGEKVKGVLDGKYGKNAWGRIRKRWKMAFLVVAVAVCFSGGLFYKTVAKSGEDEAFAGSGSGSNAADESNVGNGASVADVGSSASLEEAGDDGRSTNLIARDEWDSRGCISSIDRNTLYAINAEDAAGESQIEVAKSDSTASGSAGATDSTKSGSSSASGGSSSNSSGSSGANSGTHTHKWVPVYTTVHHDYQYETIMSYNYIPETTFYAIYPSDVKNCVHSFDRIVAKFDTEAEAKAYCEQQFKETGTVYWYNEFTAGVEHIGVLSTPQPLTHICGDPYDEEVLDHYECSICGAVK